MKVSLIVPVYNVEKFLQKCLLSIERQTYSDFELILVDDGSTDSSGKICDDYKKNHPKTIVIHQTNQGLSMARNNGVSISSGDYICFVDSDDYVSPRYIEYLMKLRELTGADVCVGKYVSVWEDYNVKYIKSGNQYRKLGSGEALEEMLYEKGFSSIAVAKLYKKDLIMKHPYPKGFLYEDMATTYRIIGDSCSVTLGDEVIYFWRQRDHSITNQNLSEKHLNALNICDSIIEYCASRFPAAISAARCKYIAKICMFMPAVMADKVNGKKTFTYLRQKSNIFIREVIKDSRTRKDIKVRSIAILMGYLPSKCITCIAEFVKPIKSKSICKKIGLLTEETRK